MWLTQREVVFVFQRAKMLYENFRLRAQWPSEPSYLEERAKPLRKEHIHLICIFSRVKRS